MDEHAFASEQDDLALAGLSGHDFVDLFLGQDFCELQGAASDQDNVTRLRPFPDDALASVLRARCRREYQERNTPEFGLRVGEIAYRVTVMDKGEGALEFSLRKSTASLRRFAELGLAPHALRTVMDPPLAGLVLVVGASGAGKTSTALSLVVERLRRFGGIGRTIEQPIEARVEGRHGAGRCSQIEVRREEDYDRELRLVLRTNARLIMLGEIRTREAARTAVLAGINGHLIISTLHAKSVEDGIERIASMAGGEISNARDLVAAGLSLVIHQEFVSTPAGPRLATRALSLLDDARVGSTIRSKIREGRISALAQEIETQHRQASWQPKT